MKMSRLDLCSGYILSAIVADSVTSLVFTSLFKFHFMFTTFAENFIVSLLICIFKVVIISGEFTLTSRIHFFHLVSDVSMAVSGLYDCVLDD